MTFEYAPAPESRSIVLIKPKYGHFIDGKFVNGRNHFATINPATEEVLSQIALGNASDVDKAVIAAQKAYTKTWSKLSGKERGNTFIASRASCKNVPANLQFLKL